MTEPQHADEELTRRIRHAVPVLIGGLLALLAGVACAIAAAATGDDTWGQAALPLLIGGLIAAIVRGATGINLLLARRILLSGTPSQELATFVEQQYALTFSGRDPMRFYPPWFVSRRRYHRLEQLGDEQVEVIEERTTRRVLLVLTDPLDFYVLVPSERRSLKRLMAQILTAVNYRQ